MKNLTKSLAVLFLTIAMTITIVPVLGTQSAYADKSIFAPSLNVEYQELTMHIGFTYEGSSPQGIGSYTMPVYAETGGPQLHIDETWTDENGDPMTGCFQLGMWYTYTVIIEATGVDEKSGFSLEEYKINMNDPYWDTWIPATDYKSESAFEDAGTSQKLTFIYRFLPASRPVGMGDKTFGMADGSCVFQGPGEYSALYNFYLINEEPLHPLLTTDFDYETDDFANSRIDLDKDGHWDISIDSFGGEDIWDSTITLTKLDTCSVSGRYAVDLSSSRDAMGVYLDRYYDNFVFDFEHKANPIRIKSKTVKVKAGKLKKKNVKIKRKKAISISKAKGPVSYIQISGSKWLTIDPATGKITVKKGTPKGTHSLNISVAAAGKGSYAPAIKDVSLNVIVK